MTPAQSHVLFSLWHEPVNQDGGHAIKPTSHLRVGFKACTAAPATCHSASVVSYVSHLCGPERRRCSSNLSWLRSLFNIGCTVQSRAILSCCRFQLPAEICTPCCCRLLIRLARLWAACFSLLFVCMETVKGWLQHHWPSQHCRSVAVGMVKRKLGYSSTARRPRKTYIWEPFK